MASQREVTRLLAEAKQGGREALDKLIPLVYDELRALASRHLRGERPGHTLQTTALAHEAYMRLIDQKDARWTDRAHFFAIASTLIRRILVDHARRRGAAKRGGGLERVPLDEHKPLDESQSVDVLLLDDALRRLAAIDSRKRRVVELRYFGGLSVDEVGEVLQVSRTTVEREWRLARAWLYRELTRGHQP